MRFIFSVHCLGDGQTVRDLAHCSLMEKPQAHGSMAFPGQTEA